MDAQLATEMHAAENRTPNSKTDQSAPVLSIRSRLSKDEMTEQVAIYGNVNDTFMDPLRTETMKNG